jgi:phosphate transport system ATP-binding protein
MDAKISIQNIYYTYADGNEALRDISCDVQANEVFVLFGPARSGKTTLLRLLNRLSDLTEGGDFRGLITFNGADIFGRAVDVYNLRRRISMVFAIPTPLPGTIRANLTYGPQMAGIRDQQVLDQRVEHSLQQAALWDEVKDRFRHLGHGPVRRPEAAAVPGPQPGHGAGGDPARQSHLRARSACRPASSRRPCAS